MFSSKELREQVSTQLNDMNVPEDHNKVFFVHADKTGVVSGVAIRTGRNWTVDGEIGYHPDATGFDFGVNVIRSW